MNSSFLFITELAYEQLKARGVIFDFLTIATRNLKARTYSFVSGILKQWLTMRMSNLSLSSSDDWMTFEIGKTIIESHCSSAFEMAVHV